MLPSQLINTVFVESTNHDPSKFQQAANEIYQMFIALGSLPFSVQVELRNARLMVDNTIVQLPGDIGFIQAIKNARPTILHLVNLYCGRTWTSIGYHMCGNRRQPESSCKPTVVVFCEPGSISDFDGLESALQATLEPIKWLLQIRPGFLDWCTRASEPVNYIEGILLKPTNGSSIGVKGNTTEAGSTGCWLTLTMTDGTKLPVLLTCYHVVASQNKAVKDKVDKDGMHYGDSIGGVTMQYPAAFDLYANLADLEYLSTSSPDTKATYDKLQQLRAMPDIGQVIAASGVRINAAGRRMDWALILTYSTMTKNVLPPNKALKTRSAYPMNDPLAYRVSEGEVVHGVGKMAVNDWLIKNGRTSGVTTGFVNRMGREVNWGTVEMTSCEAEVIGQANNFANYRDSGSMVTNQHGNMVGLLIGKDACSSDFDAGFVTPFQDIQEDVSLYTNGGTLSLA